jgi:RecB family endonuclease NucS
MSVIGKIERVPLREVWPHEARDLTTWLEENVDVLNDALGLGLVSAERERAAGAFSVDLVAQDTRGRTVVIENQLERSDHDHLGKLVTYTAMTDADVAVWIVSEPGPSACEWSRGSTIQRPLISTW